jgi:5-methylcytosine-specific restriction endonuclease McrA
MAKNKAGRPMSPEECAIRMTAFLEWRPKSPKTRAYLDTLPKRAKAAVSPDEFRSARSKKRESVKIVARADGKPIAVFTRKDRLRPKCRSLWSCRMMGRFKREHKGAEKLVRTIEMTMRQRFMLYVVQGGLCALCGEKMDGRPFQFSLDHVIPRSVGGKDGFGNLVLCHGECNGRKTNDAPTGCEMVWLLAVNACLGVQPQRF